MMPRPIQPWIGEGRPGHGLMPGPPPDLAVALGGFAQAALGLGGIGDGEVGEESHDGLLSCDGHRLKAFAGVYNTS
jgi:hypothetical protein